MTAALFVPVRRRRLAAIVVASLGGLTCLPWPATSSSPLLPPPFELIEHGPAGGAAWQGLIRFPRVPALRRPTVVYLPPGFSTLRRYPVVYLLHGLPGSPYEYLDGLRLTQVADHAISSGLLRPFVAVVPPAGLDVHHGDWTGVWESYLVDDVVPWIDAHLPTIAATRGRTLAGLSAGGYGAIDIGLRHPRLFRTLESWSGYFTPLRAGVLRQADDDTLASHDPSLLVRREAGLLDRLGTCFFLSAGTTHDRHSTRAAEAFAAELQALGLHYRLWLGPGGHDGSFWRSQLPDALWYALSASPSQSVGRTSRLRRRWSGSRW